MEYTLTINKGSYNKTHPYKLTITGNELKNFLKRIEKYQMFAWVFKSKEEAEKAISEILSRYALYNDTLIGIETIKKTFKE